MIAISIDRQTSAIIAISLDGGLVALKGIITSQSLFKTFKNC